MRLGDSFLSCSICDVWAREVNDSCDLFVVGLKISLSEGMVFLLVILVMF